MLCCVVSAPTRQPEGDCYNHINLIVSHTLVPHTFDPSYVQIAYTPVRQYANIQYILKPYTPIPMYYLDRPANFYTQFKVIVSFDYTPIRLYALSFISM